MVKENNEIVYQSEKTYELLKLSFKQAPNKYLKFGYNLECFIHSIGLYQSSEPKQLSVGQFKICDDGCGIHDCVGMIPNIYNNMNKCLKQRIYIVYI